MAAANVISAALNVRQAMTIEKQTSVRMIFFIMCEVVDRQRREPKDGGMEAGRHRRLRWSKRAKVRLRALHISSHFRRHRKAQKLATLNTVAAATEPPATTWMG